MRQRQAVLATCNLNQWAMDFDGNLARVLASIAQAKAKGAKYRLGPELEIPGYGCEDHFCEQDTVEHSWECLLEIIKGGHTEGIVCDIGMPVVHRGVRYNCRAFVLDGKILLLRPKMYLANDGNYRETRYFATWKRPRTVEEHHLPLDISDTTGQKTCPFGDATLSFNDLVLAAETCEELFTPDAPHIQLALNGVEVIANGSGSHHQLRKLHQRMDLMKSCTAKAGGVYLYANQRGCDGSRLYFDGCASVLLNGSVLEQGRQFGLADVEVVTAAVDLEEVVSWRGSIGSLREQASSVERIPTITVDFSMCSSAPVRISLPQEPRYLAAEEEIAYGPACWLWDYMRRSGASGYLLPLSGGADSSSTAAITGCMCQLVVKAIAGGDATVEADARRIGQYEPGEVVDDPKDLANRLFTTVYMGTGNSSAETLNRSKDLAAEIGSYHLNVKIDSVVSALVALFGTITGKTPKFRVDGGCVAENLALQNIQARLRMVLAFFLAQLVNWVRGRSGFMLVLGSANVDEGLRGYLTKYDCSSADINPIGGISKDVGVWPLDYNKVKGLAYRQDISPPCSSSLHSTSSGSNVASNDPGASRAQIQAPQRAAAIAEAQDILANSTGRSQAPPTQELPMEEAARRYLMYTRMADQAKRDMEALSGMDTWQPTAEDILRPDPLVVGRKGRAEAQHAQVFTCEESVLLTENRDKLRRDGPDLKALLSSAVTTLKMEIRRLKSTWEAVHKKVRQADVIRGKVERFIARAEEFADAGQLGPVRAALKSIAKEKSTLVKLKAEADKHMDGVPDLLYAVEGARSTVDTYHDKYDYLLQCAGKEPLDHPKNTDPNLYADTETLCDNATIDLERIEAAVVEVELMCGECEEELVNRAVTKKADAVAARKRHAIMATQQAPKRMALEDVTNTQNNSPAIYEPTPLIKNGASVLLSAAKASESMELGVGAGGTDMDVPHRGGSRGESSPSAEPPFEERAPRGLAKLLEEL